MLIAYQQRVRLLLGDETFKWLRDGDLTNYINESRNQVAGESECLSDYSTLAVTAPTMNYPFSSIVVSASNVTAGFGSVLNVRMGGVLIGSGQQLVYPRAWSWFQLYELDQVVPTAAQPRVLAQQGQGTAGTLWVNLPDTNYTLNLDTICLPVALVSDTTAEAIPQLWQNAICYYAAWIALMAHPDQARGKADDMMQRYQQMMTMARVAANPQTMRHIWSQAPDIADQNRYGIQGRGAA